jgi:hypothetical protein
MNLMDRRMKALSERAAPFQKGSNGQASERQWCSSVVPIYFNAWHYSDTNLWASLITHVFEALFDYLRPKVDEVKLLQSRLQNAGGVTALACEEATVASENVRKASEELSRAQVESQNAKEVMRGLIDGLRSLIPDLCTPGNKDRLFDLLGVSADVATLSELIEKRKELTSLGGRMKALWRRAVAREGRATRIGWLLGALIVASLSRLIAIHVRELQPMMTWIGPRGQTLLIALSAFAGWLTPSIKQLQGGLKQLEEWQNRAESAQRSIPQDPRVVDAKNALQSAEATARAAELALIEARSRESELMLALNELHPGRRLSRFIEARVMSADYRGQLGLVSLARRDFEELSRIFADVESRKADAGETQEQARAFGDLRSSVDRVVLFIDDLDRCEPEKVVDVLQAVHLLLAYPLFGVVVGVDQRCLRQSLSMRFKGLLTPNRAKDPEGNDRRSNVDDIPATPLDYLEKIFHIPFHLPPMDPVGFANLVESLTEPNAAINSPAPVPREEAPTDTKAAAVEGTEAVGKFTEAAVGVLGSAHLHRWERDALKSYHSLIHTPRGATRLLNTYRLVRAGVPSAEWDTFRGDQEGTGESRLAMLFLAIAAGRPAVAREWFQLLRQGQYPSSPLSEEVSEADRPAWESFGRLYEETKDQVGVSVTQELVIKWIDRVELFTF